MFLRIFRILIYEFFYKIFNTYYVIFVWIFSTVQNWEKSAYFWPIRNLFLFFNCEILVKKFVDSYLESSWKHVMNSIIVVVQHSELVQTSRDMIYNLTCTIQAPGESVVSSGYVRTHHMFSRILNFLFVIVFSRKKMSFPYK